MIWITVILTIVIVTFVWRSGRGVVRHLDYIDKSLNELLRRGYDNGFLMIKLSYTRKFIQIRKYITSPGEYGIQLAFPKAKWSLPYFHDVERLCRSIKSANCCIDDAGGMDFLYMDFGQDVVNADVCIRRILVEIFGVTQSTKLFVTLEKAALFDVLVDDPNTFYSESVKDVLKELKKGNANQNIEPTVKTPAE